MKKRSSVKTTGRKVKLCKQDKIFYGIGYSIILLLVLLVLYPLIYIVSASFSSGSAILGGRVWLWPVDISFSGYEMVLHDRNVFIGYRNTIFYTAVGTLLNIVMTMLCAYPLSRNQLRGRGVIMFLFLFTMIFSGGMIPSYILVKKLGMMNTIWAMLLPGAMSVYNMIVARTFIQSNIPNELLEAAKIDGCDDIGFFFKIVLPLSKTIMAVLVMWYAVGHWNSYFNAFLYLTDSELYPLQIFLRDLLVKSEVNVGMLTQTLLTAEVKTMEHVLKYAMIVVSTAPLLMVYPFVQKYFVKGVMIGSVKG